ncbi:hypothetical protein GGS26DRAFT_67249 [Hypomontagnella submonticulosa]|nr:hypothetical protein GGS26DRAFT_67249 [Hypomontagnella submonticulosa]
MDDQFNGRTDDDLFADDFEPVEAQEEQSPTMKGNATATTIENLPQPASPTEPAAATEPTPIPRTPRGLNQSRHAKPTAPSSHHQPRPRKQSPKPVAPEPHRETPATTPPAAPAAASAAAKGNGTSTGNKKPSVSAAKPGQNTAEVDRLASGANPRTKLTETELAAKMEQMRILAIEKTKQFEQAQRDSRSHAIAYEKGMEDARKRRAEEAERRRRGEEERRRMDDEREANRERKLRAMGAKEGGNWDEGKALVEEREKRAGFRGANGGIRGARNSHGLGGSRFADRDNGNAPPREFGPDDFRGRNRGHGRGGSTRGGGRGGRGGFNHDGERGGNKPATQNGNLPHQQTKTPQVPPKAEDFPALPPAKKIDTTTTSKDAANTTSLSPSLNSPPIGKWDDEMAALDAKGN